MLQILKTVLKRSFPRLALIFEVYVLLVRRRDSYLHTTGWLRSLQEKRPVDQWGKALPWMNYPVIEFLGDRLNKEMSLFEFGSGYSTFFYARHVREVTSVEYDEEWFHKIDARRPPNVRLILEPKDVDGRYCRTIVRDRCKFQVVVVDGRDRVNCVKQSVQALSQDGVIILDDSDRDAYEEAFSYAKSVGFSLITFSGLKPTGPERHRTTIFYREENCLKI